MYVRRGIHVHHLLRDSWPFLIGVSLWSGIVVYLNEILELRFLSIPIVPVTTIGIAVSLYLGFKSTSAYSRWWEARQVWGAIITGSRDWGNSVLNLIYADGRKLDPAVRQDLIRRHIAWVHALAFQLRARSRLKAAGATYAFGRRLVFQDADYHQTPESYRRFLSAEEIAEVEATGNIATHLLRRQGDRLRELAEQGFLDSYRHVAMMAVITALFDGQGKCERIKNTPFPRQVANFGLMFTWIFIILLPLAFVDSFEAETALRSMSEEASLDYLLLMIPFTLLISWVFHIMERVSDSTEDPFEGGVADVPISALARTIEIELLEMMGAEDVPEPMQPVDGVLY